MRERRMLKTIRVSAMLLALAGSVYAGEVLTPPAPQPQGATVQEPTMNDEDTIGAMDTLTQIILTVLASVLP